MRQQHCRYDVAHVDVGLALRSVAEDGQAGRVLAQVAHEVEADAVGLAGADDVAEAEQRSR